jgi:hypothetical protein
MTYCVLTALESLTASADVSAAIVDTPQYRFADMEVAQ